MRLNRLNEMEAYILQCSNVSLEALASHFSISINTVRRDIAEILKKGTIKKVYGGVMAVDPHRIAALSAHNESNVQTKQTIGALAATLIKDEYTIFLDAGTTAVQIIPFLEGKKNITIVTNSLRIVNETVKHPQLNLLVMGGYYDDATHAFAGTRTLESISNVDYDLVFIGTSGISTTRGLTTDPFFEESIKRLLIGNNPGKVVLLADSSKFDKSVSLSFGKLEDVAYVISEVRPPEKYLELVGDAQTRFLWPEHTK